MKHHHLPWFFALAAACTADVGAPATEDWELSEPDPLERPDAAPDMLAPPVEPPTMEPDMSEPEVGPRVAVAPRTLLFRPTPIGGGDALDVMVTNLGDQPLELTEVWLGEEPADGVESFAPGPGWVDDVILAPEETLTLTVLWVPEDDTPDQGVLRFRTNDPASPLVEVELLGQEPLLNECPTPVAYASVPQGRPTANLTTEALQTVLLTGLESFDLEGSILEYEWNIIEKPRDSNARLQPNNAQAEPKLFLDMEGRYVLELVVRDELGLVSCEPARVVINATP